MTMENPGIGKMGVNIGLINYPEPKQHSLSGRVSGSGESIKDPPNEKGNFTCLVDDVFHSKTKIGGYEGSERGIVA